MSKTNQAPKVDPMVAAAQLQELQLKLAQAEEENARLKANKSTSNGLKVSAKGAVSLYGLGKWPVTLYKSQWLKVIELVPTIKQFIEDNNDKLKTKD